MDELSRHILTELQSHASADFRAGMARFGINPEGTLGISMPIIRSIAKRHRLDHALALSLWDSGLHEARILAALVDDPRLVTPAQMEDWAHDFDSWDVCDQVCGQLFDRTPFAWGTAFDWSRAEAEFVKRAGFVLMATLSIHDKTAPDERFEAFFPEIVRGSSDPRNFVKKAVNWAIRQIGKRNLSLHSAAVELAERVLDQGTPTARWIARDALRELRAPRTLERLVSKSQKRRG